MEYLQCKIEYNFAIISTLICICMIVYGRTGKCSTIVNAHVQAQIGITYSANNLARTDIMIFRRFKPSVIISELPKTNTDYKAPPHIVNKMYF